MNNDEKNIEIVSGNGDDLNISPVYDNLDIAKPSEDTNTKKNVIIPDVKNKAAFHIMHLIFAQKGASLLGERKKCSTFL